MFPCLHIRNILLINIYIRVNFFSFLFKYVLISLILPLVFLLTAVTETFNELTLLLSSLEPATLWGKSLQDNLRLPALKMNIFFSFENGI